MGKPRTFRSSIKAFHEALSSLKPSTPLCMQQPRTDSFREHLHLLASFDSIYYTAPSSSSSSSSILLPITSSAMSQSPHLCPVGDEVETGAVATRCPSSCSSYSCISGTPETVGLVPTGTISSQRFFFSPRTSNSIMEEAKLDAVVARKIGCLSNSSYGFDVGSRKVASFCEESISLELASQDPYKDFRVSMEEMVEAHGLTEWSGLQELLHCYLQLNDKKTHKIILLAFVDLLMNLVCPPGSSSFSSTTSSSPILPMHPCSSPLLHLCSD